MTDVNPGGLPLRGAKTQAAHFAPAAFAFVACLLVLLRYGTPFVPILTYCLYLLLVECLPGTLLWRVIRAQRVSFAEDVAIGTTIGLAVQATLGWALAPLGLAAYSALWSPLVVVVTVCVPRFRGAWRRSTSEARQSILGSWMMAVVVIVAAVWIGATSFANNQISQIPGMPGQYYAPHPYGDMTFHQSLAVGIDRFYPLVYPYVSVSPLKYQIFVYEHLANAAQLTGIDPTVLVMRLITIPLTVLTIVLAGVITVRISRRGWAAGLGSVLAVLAVPLSVYPGNLSVLNNDVGTLNIGTFRSPTQTFGEPIFLVLLVVTCIAIQSARKTRLAPTYVLFAVLAFAAECSKATLLPILGAGIALGFCVQLIIQRRINFRLLVLGILTVACQLLSMAAVYGFSSHGLDPGFLEMVWRSSGAQMLGPEITSKELAFLTVLTLLAWISTAAGGVLLIVLRWRRTTTWLLMGAIIGGICAALLFNQDGLSQSYFLRTAAPIFGTVSALGFVACVDRLAVRKRTVVGLLASLSCLGLVLVLVAHRVSPTLQLGAQYTMYQLAVPWLVVVLGILLLGAVVAIVARFRSGFRGRRMLLLGTMAACLGIVGGCFSPVLGVAARAMPNYGQPVSYGTEGVAAIPAGGAEAARWLRDHSDPQDIVATNAHCYLDSCIPKHFYISAYSQRRVLVEGWAYATPAADWEKTASDPNAFWDPELLAENDAVFANPTEENAEALVQDYGVKWLFVDRTVSEESPQLANYATLEYQNADAAVYRIDS